jgi:uncharacterized lipoprotein
LKHAAVLVAVLALALSGCGSLSKAARNLRSNDTKASAKSEKDVAACEKMCSVAGDAEGNSVAVEKCQKKCRQ